MKLLFKNTTQYTKAVYQKFLIFHNKKYRFSYIFYTVVIVAFFLSSLIFQVKQHNYSTSLILCLILTAFILWRFFRPVAEITKEYESDTIQKEIAFTFKFYDKFFIIEDDKEYSKIKYYELYRAFETTDFFYLYIDKTHAFLINKLNFETNNPTDFSKFIKRKCLWKFKKIK